MSEEQQYFLYPGGIYISKDPVVVTTVLGSCVAVCVWDPVIKYGGINHYMLPFWNGEGLATPRYGSIATEKLVQGMLDLGSNKKDLLAKIFGGARVLQIHNHSLDIGKNNILVAQQFLKENQIPVKAEHVGGEQGRKLKFYTDTGVVMMKLLSKQQCNTSIESGSMR